MAKTKHVRDDILYSRFVNSVYGTGANLVGSYASDTDRKWQGTTVYKPGDFVEPTAATTLWRCVVGGTTGATEPAWGTPSTRGTVTDGTVTWERYDGHLHDGRDMDGSSPKVLLTGAAEVSGTLPLSHVEQHPSGTIAAKISAVYFSSEATFNILYDVIGNMVFLHFPEVTGNPTNGNHQLAIEPQTTWPVAILPANARSLPFIAANRVAYNCAEISILAGNSAAWYVSLGQQVTEDGFDIIRFEPDQWGDDLAKGIRAQTITYRL